MADYQRLKISEVVVTVVRFTDSSLSDPWISMADASPQDPFAASRGLGAELRQLVDEGRKHLLLNFCDVTYVASAVQGELLRLREKVRAAHGTLTLTNMNPNVLKMFKVPKLDTVFNIRNDQADALPSI